MRPALIARVQRLLDQQAAESGTVNEQIAWNPLAAGEDDCRDESVCRPKYGFPNLAFRTAHAASLSEIPQVLCVEARVELIGIGDARQGGFWAEIGRWHEPAPQRRDTIQTIRGNVGYLAREMGP